MMSLPLYYTLTAAGAFVLCVALMPLVIVAARRLGLVDQPHARKVHRKPIPCIGGVAIALSVLTAATAAVLIDHFGTGEAAWPWLPRELLTVLAVSAFVFGVALFDDIYPVPAKYKLVMLLAAGAAICGVGVSIDGLYAQHGLYMSLGLLAWPATMLWVTGMTTAVNFIDGLDGLAAGLVAFAAGLLAAMLIAAGEPAIAAIALALCAALGAFLLFNSHPAKVFMGDGGSMFISFLLAACCVLAAPRIGTMKAMIVPAAALSVPILDTALTIFRRRFVERRSIFSAERGHIHHRLLDLGLSQRKAVFLIYGVSLIATGIAWMALWAEGWASFGVLALLVPLLLGFFRAAGSIRSRDILDAVRRKRLADRAEHEDRQLFEEMQLRFQRVRTFSEWWQVVCQTADAMDFASIDLPVIGRDGEQRTLRWRPTDPSLEQAEAIAATVPVRERRYESGPLHADVRVIATTSLERAGQRLAMFSRLMNEHSVADIRDVDAATGNGNGQVHHEPRGVLGWWMRRNGNGHSHNGSANARRIAPAPPAPETADSVVQQLRVAIVHDFLYTYAGAERVLEQMVQMYPHADLFSLFDFLPEDQRGFIANKPVHTSFLQHMPFARKHHRAYLPLMPLAIEQLDVSNYDLVLSSSYLAAKSVITGPDQLHVCYCHSPVRSAWDMQHQYLNQSGIGYSVRGLAARAILHYIRNWDARSALGVDAFVANSHFVARRIQKLYRREATVVYPPVDTDSFALEANKDDYYVTASRFVPYKRIDLVVQAFNRMPDRRLVVIGEGPEATRIKRLAGANVELVGHQSAADLKQYLQRARAFLFAAEEDFGIAPVEAMACGTPVIAYGRGGVTESVLANESGLFFDSQTPESIVEAVEQFEARLSAWDPGVVRARAEQFAVDTFRTHLTRVVEQHWSEFTNARDRQPTGGAVPVTQSATDAPDAIKVNGATVKLEAPAGTSSTAPAD